MLAQNSILTDIDLSENKIEFEGVDKLFN